MKYLTTLPIETYKSQEWFSDKEVDIYQEDGYTIIQIVNSKTKKQISIRNVGKLNMDGSIQISVDEYTFATNRKKSISFSIPYALSEIFIESLTQSKI